MIDYGNGFESTSRPFTSVNKDKYNSQETGLKWEFLKFTFLFHPRNMANRIQIVIAIIISVCGPLAVQCFSAGAPDAECVNMTPQHHVDPQKGPSPYNIIISKNTIHAGETIKVSIVGKTADDNFKGFIVQARVGESPVGTFDASPSRQYVQLLNCGSSRSVSLFAHYLNDKPNIAKS